MTSKEQPAVLVKCLWCPALLPFDTDADKEAAHAHTAACARSGNPAREVVQTAPVAKATNPWKVKS